MGLGDFILYKNMERKFEVRGLVSFSLVVPAFLEACISASSFGVSLRHYLRLASQPGLVKNEKQEKKLILRVLFVNLILVQLSKKVYVFKLVHTFI